MCDDERESREVPLDPQAFERMSGDAALWARGPESGDAEVQKQAPAHAEALAALALLVETRLTARQREIVDLYFDRGKTQQEIAAVLGISQQVVSKQLFGVMRKGRRVGGAIRKLRKLLEASGVHFEEDES